jgi:DNA-binding ferritin-like protein (Dps family)
VAEFADELLRNARTYFADWHEALNRDIHEKLGGSETT